MKSSRMIAVLVTGLATLMLPGCGSSAPAGNPERPVVLTQVEGTDRFEVTLTEQSQQRLGISTSPVATAAGHTVVPYAAIVYDGQGVTWVYTPGTKALTWVRKPITVTSIDGDAAVVTTGPAVGTQVVVVGAPELLGAEAQIAGEE